ncbi:hypothetical protein Cyrtocomes_00626 [Candidatus Cyrtobacter comes]|uniref:Uncharacterized protein n=1 Tax=Candidatus Cyrtobacter comes TaxID=675776 RepID=A0ABU5L8N6_9RICK|nr:hypothetical protein [Candidatus Cyrtobacter comes]MDZ5762250.1 hypothetical protein [Candidatus Cyrtobacter comes]
MKKDLSDKIGTTLSQEDTKEELLAQIGTTLSQEFGIELKEDELIKLCDDLALFFSEYSTKDYEGLINNHPYFRTLSKMLLEPRRFINELRLNEYIDDLTYGAFREYIIESIDLFIKETIKELKKDHDKDYIEQITKRWNKEKALQLVTKNRDSNMPLGVKKQPTKTIDPKKLTQVIGVQQQQHNTQTLSYANETLFPKSYQLVKAFIKNDLFTKYFLDLNRTVCTAIESDLKEPIIWDIMTKNPMLAKIIIINARTNLASFQKYTQLLKSYPEIVKIISMESAYTCTQNNFIVLLSSVLNTKVNKKLFELLTQEVREEVMKWAIKNQESFSEAFMPLVCTIFEIFDITSDKELINKWVELINKIEYKNVLLSEKNSNLRHPLVVELSKLATSNSIKFQLATSLFALGKYKFKNFINRIERNDKVKQFVAKHPKFIEKLSKYGEHEYKNMLQLFENQSLYDLMNRHPHILDSLLQKQLQLGRVSSMFHRSTPNVNRTLKEGLFYFAKHAENLLVAAAYLDLNHQPISYSDMVKYITQDDCKKLGQLLEIIKVAEILAQNPKIAHELAKQNIANLRERLMDEQLIPYLQKNPDYLIKIANMTSENFEAFKQDPEKYIKNKKTDMQHIVATLNEAPSSPRVTALSRERSPASDLAAADYITRYLLNMCKLKGQDIDKVASSIEYIEHITLEIDRKLDDLKRMSEQQTILDKLNELRTTLQECLGTVNKGFAK